MPLLPPMFNRTAAPSRFIPARLHFLPVRLGPPPSVSLRVPLRSISFFLFSVVVAIVSAQRAPAATCAVWTNLAPASAPSPRTDHVMAYDSARDRIVLFSGVTAGVEQTSTWEYAPATNSWVVRTSTGPSAREGHAMVYDSGHSRTILFSGFTAGSGYQNATWALTSVAGSLWTVVANTGPSPRSGHSMAYDSARDRIVLFGGNNAGGRQNDTWEFNCATNVWLNVSPPSGPSARNLHAMVYDKDRQRTILFGGNSITGVSAETWEWDGSSWTLIDIPGPSARYDTSMIYDAGRGRTVLFGGTSSSPNETWEYTGAAWTRYSISAPHDRWDCDMIYDSLRGNTIMFGGTSVPTGDLGDTWRLALSPWTQLATGPVGARYDHCMAEDSTRGGVLFFGGNQPAGPQLGDTLFLDSNFFLQVATTGPAPRVYSAMADDPARGQVILFGGSAVNFVNDTWAWQGPGTGWVHLFPANSPSPRGLHAMAYDSARDRIVLYGGVSANTLGDTWEWDGADWTQLFPAHSPGPRSRHAMAYDVLRARTVLYAGVNGEATLTGTWEWDGDDWTQVTTPTSPGQRYSHTLTWNGARKRVEQFGGYNTPASSSSNQTWEFTGAAWRFLPGSLPLSRTQHAAAYDSVKGVIVMFGGLGMGAYNDVWETRLEPAVVMFHPASLSVYTGDLAQFTVSGCGSGALSYQWRKNESNLVDGDVVTGVNTPTLSIFPADPFDNGAYDCIVSNACAASTSAKATLLVTAAPPPCPADFNSDGQVGSADLAQLLGAWGSGPGPADLNNDGDVGSADLAQLLGAWGPCP